MEGVRAPAARWGAFVARHRWAVVAVWAALFVASAFVASGATRLLSPASFSADTEATRAADLLRREFPDRREKDGRPQLQSDGERNDGGPGAARARW